MADEINHVIVLMLENRSFDHVLGALGPDLGFDGVSTPPRQNLDDAGNSYAQVLGASPVIRFDPKHELEHIAQQLAGGNLGFVKDFAHAYPTAGPPDYAEVMKCHDNLPAIHTLARAFTVCDRWFASVPGPTWPNRFFVHSGTSLGHVAMPNGLLDANLHWYDQTTLYDRLNERGKKWAIYYGDVPQSLILVHQLEPQNASKYKKMTQFFVDVSGPAADFPDYCFIEPTYYQPGANDAHPTHNILDADQLVGEVYNALVANDALWQQSLLVVLTDEHGGFYDHVSPPATIAPDQHVEEFAFNTLGVRVPAILVSPWVAAGVFSQQLDHTSLLRYLIDKWGLGPLGARAQQANSLVGAITSTPQATSQIILPGSVPSPPPPISGRPQMGSHQSALFALTQLLESMTSFAAGTLEARLRQFLTGYDGAVDVAIQRVEQFLGQARANAPPPT